MKTRLFISLVSLGLLAGCTGSTKPDAPAGPAPVEDRSISGKRSQAHIVNKASEVLPMEEARAEPSRPRKTVVMENSMAEKAVVQSRRALPAGAPVKPVPDVALLETRKPTEPKKRSSSPASDRDSPAVDSLLSDANRLLSEGNQDGAAASLERALRVEPRDAYLWHRLAYVRLQQVRASQAESMALKSISLSGDKTELINSNWRLISRARKLLNDHEGAKDATARIR